jgi:1-acyl-sn-glycerol-3-phosphate acyltransferase
MAYSNALQKHPDHHPMAKRSIDRVSLRYRLLKVYAIFVHWIFYRRIEVKFRERIPKDRPVLLAPNHQNALMDAMAPLLTSRRDPVFLARADIFKNKFIAGILRFLKILPVYRIRDGAGELGKNEAVFQEAMAVLMRKRSPVCIMPEGNHGNKRRLRPLVKGIFRVAFQAQETYGDNPGVVIVPVGIDYSKYHIFRGKLFIQFGEPIEVSEYYPAYLENQAKTINAIRSRLAEEMKKYMIDIQSEDHYEMYMTLRSVYNDDMRKRMGHGKNTLYHRLLADQQMIRELYEIEQQDGEKIRVLDELCSPYREGLASLDMRDWLFRHSSYSWTGLILAGIGMLILLPVFLYGSITNYFPYWFTGSVSRRIKDQQFHSTFKYVVGLILFPLYYLILFIPVWILADPGWIKWVWLASLPVTGIFAHVYYIWFRKLRSLSKFQVLTSRKDSRLESLKGLRKQIIARVDKLIRE